MEEKGADSLNGSDLFRGNSELLTMAAVTADLLARGRTKEELARMAAFFDVLGDALGLLALPDQPPR